MDIVKMGNVQLTKDEALQIFKNYGYIVTYSKIYQLHYSSAQERVYGTVVYQSKGMTARGRFFKFNAASVNNLVGYRLVND